MRYLTCFTGLDSDLWLLCMCVCVCVCVKSLQSCLTLCNPMDYSPPGSSVHGILQTRTLEWVAMTSSRESFWPRDWTCVSCDSCIAGGFFKVDSLLLSHRGSPLWLLWKWKWKSALSLCDPMDYTDHGILQARILERVAFPFSRESSQPRDQTEHSLIAGGFFTNWVIVGLL